MDNYGFPRIMRFLTVFYLLVMLLGLSACQTSIFGSATNVQPESIVQDFIEAQNAGDVEGALTLLADDAVIQLVPPPMEGDDGIFSGKEEIRTWYEILASQNGSGEISDVNVEGNQVTAILTYTDESLKQIGVEYIDNEWVVSLQDGKIQSYTATLTEASLDELMAAMANAQGNEDTPAK